MRTFIIKLLETLLFRLSLRHGQDDFDNADKRWVEPL